MVLFGHVSTILEKEPLVSEATKLYERARIKSLKGPKCSHTYILYEQLFLFKACFEPPFWVIM
jgi:hypothetical protein